MTPEKFKTRVDKAEKRVRDMDVMDGFADRHPLTIMLALEAGLMRPETGAAFDAYVMLRDLALEAQKGANPNAIRN